MRTNTIEEESMTNTTVIYLYLLYEYCIDSKYGAAAQRNMNA